MMCAEHLSRTASLGAWKVLCPHTHLDEGLEASFSGLLFLLADILSPSVTPNLLGRQEEKQGEKGGVTKAREGGPLYSKLTV